jgi:cysteinyl-tRNA synthetase
VVVGDLIGLRLYNTRTRTVEPFRPLRGDVVRVYVCGLTPSAEAHLGHARSFLFFDVLRSYLEYCGYRVRFVQNVTDVDDRSIAAARERGTTYDKIVAEHFTSFKASMRKLGVREPDEEPHATAYVAEIQDMVRRLIRAGDAYVAEDGIYYAVRTFAGYGNLSGRNVDELRSGARIEVDEHKEDPLDFALWKFSRPGEPSWTFDPYGSGRPGWHIECSAMSRALLDPEGEGFDIHGGGADLIFPHHENEIAQSEPLMRRPPMANVWMHGGLLLFDSRKMSKSLGNFEPLSALLERHDPQAIRLLFLQTGYRKVMNFTEDSIGAATVVLERLKKAYRSLKRLAGDGAAPVKSDETGLLARLSGALDDDMNTAAALAETIRFASSLDASREPVPRTAHAEYERALRLLGLDPNESWLLEPQWATMDATSEASADAHGATLDWENDPGAAAETIAKAREEARKRKDWSAADRYRNELVEHGYEIIDTAEGPRWRRIDGR